MRREGLKARVTELPSSHRPDRRVCFQPSETTRRLPCGEQNATEEETHVLPREKMTREPLKNAAVDPGLPFIFIKLAFNFLHGPGHLHLWRKCAWGVWTGYVCGKHSKARWPRHPHGHLETHDETAHGYFLSGNNKRTNIRKYETKF